MTLVFAVSLSMYICIYGYMYIYIILAWERVSGLGASFSLCSFSSHNVYLCLQMDTLAL